MALGLVIGFAAIMLPLARTNAQFSWHRAELSWWLQLGIALKAFLVPAFVEEGIWRVLLLPHRTEPLSPRQWWIAGLPVLALFVLAHPLNSLTFYPAAAPVFNQPLFWLGSTLLGLICMATYWRSGSWWVPTVIHWLVVVIWLLGFGGYDRLHG